MGRVEVQGNGIRVHAENEGVDTSIVGQLVFEHDEEGIRVVLAMEMWGGEEQEMTEALLGLLVKTFQTNSVTIKIDGQTTTIPPAYRSPLKSFKQLKQLPRLTDVPKRMSDDEDLLAIDFGGHDQRVTLEQTKKLEKFGLTDFDIDEDIPF